MGQQALRAMLKGMVHTCSDKCWVDGVEGTDEINSLGLTL